MNKIFSVYKPKGPTSNQMLNKIRGIVRTRQQLTQLGGRSAKVGHAGTLDPLAQGVLVVGIGREATRQLGEVVKKEKEYIAKIKLGETSTTDDEEGVKLKVESCKVIKLDDVEKILPKFVGKIMQVPPIYSAIKISGKEAYKRARKGENIKMQSREIEIKEIQILKYKWPYLKIKIVCGPGTYIRSLARDIGKELGVGGHLADLERTRVGDFYKKNAVLEDDLENFIKS